MCDAKTVKRLSVALQNLAMECDLQGATSDSSIIAASVRAAYELLYELQEDKPKCKGCGGCDA